MRKFRGSGAVKSAEFALMYERFLLQGDGCASGGTRSETDSDEALRDLEALSQEGSLDGLSDSEAHLDDPIASYGMLKER
jgi:hypothetical protein